MSEDKNNRNPSGFEQLAKDGRLDMKMVKDGGNYSDTDAVALLDELADYRRGHLTANGKILPWKTVAEQVGIAASTLAEIRGGTYRGDRQKYLRQIDDFLAQERARAGRFDDRTFAQIGTVQKAWATMKAAMKYNSMAAIIASSGMGKTMLATAFAAEYDAAVYIRIDESSGDQRGVSLLIWKALNMVGNKTHRERLGTLIAYFRKNLRAVIIIDEAQKLRQDGLEVVRDIHDGSDPTGRRNTPVVFFGDEHFYSLIVKARNGEVSPIKPQMTSRLYPVLNLTAEAGNDGSGQPFTVEDISKILRNSRLRVVTDDGIRWLMRLANVPGYGHLRRAMTVARMAFDIAPQMPVTTKDLQTALRMVIGPRAVEEIDTAAGGSLLKVG